MAQRRFSPIRRIRGLLLVFMILLVAALVGLYLFGRAGRPAPDAALPAEDTDIPGGEITLIGEGFEFTHSEGERPIFRIRGESLRADRAGTVYLDGVGLTLYDPEGTAYEVAAERASFNREDRQARLAGDVVLRGPDATRLRTRGLRLVDQGKVLVSTGPVEFAFQGMQGRADALRVNRERNVYVMAGGVAVENLPQAERTFTLEANRLTFERPRHQVSAEGDVVVTHGDDRVEANRINAFLDDEDSQVVFLRARWEVAGRLTVPEGGLQTLATPGAAGGGGDGGVPAGQVIRFQGRSLALLRDLEGQLRNVELEGSPLEPVVVDTPTEAGTVQRLVAGYVVGDFQNGVLATARAFNQPRLLELQRRSSDPADALRRLDGRRLEAVFSADGRLIRVGAEEEVRYRDPQVEGSGDRATFDVLEDKARFFGDPVRMVSPRGELLAPEVAYDQGEGLLHATGGVRALAREAESMGLGGTPLAEGEGPVRIESAEAFWRDDPRGALFRGGVRAWRGENLLLADVVRADQEAPGRQTLVASGGVRTVWIPAPSAVGGGAAGTGVPAETGGTAEGTAAGEPARAPVEVTANTLTYRKPLEILSYEGQVRAKQGRQDLACRRLEIELNEDGEAEVLTCIDDVVLDDRAAGNSARGARAVYDLPSRSVTMTGDPVTLKKSDGAQVQGGRVVYDLTSGKARVVGEEKTGDAPPPTAGDPPEPTP